MRSRTEGARAWLLLCTGMSVATLLAGQSVMGSVVAQPLHVDGRAALDAPFALDTRTAPERRGGIPVLDDAGRTRPETSTVRGSVVAPGAPTVVVTTHAQEADDQAVAPGSWAWDFEDGMQGWTSWHHVEAGGGRGRVDKGRPAWARRAGTQGGHHLVPVRDDAVAVPRGVAALQSPSLEPGPGTVREVQVRFRYRWHVGGVSSAQVRLRWWPSEFGGGSVFRDLRPADDWREVELRVELGHHLERLDVRLDVAFENGLASGHCDPAVGFDDDACELGVWVDDVEVELR